MQALITSNTFAMKSSLLRSLYISLAILSVSSVLLLTGCFDSFKKDAETQAPGGVEVSNADLETTTVESVTEVTAPAKQETPKTEAKVEVKVEAKTEVKETPKTETAAQETPKPAALKTFNMTADEFAFAPSTITVNEGDMVRIVITSKEGGHGIVIPDFGVNKVINAGSPAVVEFTANKKGTFAFRCSIFCGGGHGDMKGTLIVK